MPAILKGFLERVLQPDLWRCSGGEGDWKILKGKSARIIMTMGMPGWFYRLWFGAHALKLLRRNILHFTGVAPIHATIHGVHRVGERTTRRRAVAAGDGGARARGRIGGGRRSMKGSTSSPFTVCASAWPGTPNTSGSRSFAGT